MDYDGSEESDEDESSIKSPVRAQFQTAGPNAVLVGAMKPDDDAGDEEVGDDFDDFEEGAEGEDFGDFDQAEDEPELAEPPSRQPSVPLTVPQFVSRPCTVFGRLCQSIIPPAKQICPDQLY